MHAPLVSASPRVSVPDISHAWDGVDHAEGLAIGADGTVWCGGEDGQVYRGRLDGDPQQIATLPGQALAFALDDSGGAFVTVLGDVPGVYRVEPDGGIARVSSGTEELPAETPNYPVLLPSGVLLWSDSGQWGADDGRIYAVDQHGTRVVDTSCRAFTNGLALAPDGRTLVVAESTLPGVAALRVEPDGTLSDRRVLVDMPGTVPDGLAFDARGRLVISCYAPDVIYLLEDGRLEALAYDPQRVALSSPTNVAFIPGSTTLVVANLGVRYLSLLTHDVPGAPLVAVRALAVEETLVP